MSLASNSRFLQGAFQVLSLTEPESKGLWLTKGLIWSIEKGSGHTLPAIPSRKGSLKHNEDFE